ncbi:MAG TPA: glycosyltransferase family 4 protein [Bacteroidota bacterium]|nr:glycosyltransferase family 4 protein [Bacteroidota bacterium]
MNALFVNSHRSWGGGEVSLCQITEGLRARGHKVTIICHPQSALHLHLKEGPDEAVPLQLRGDLDPFTIAKIFRLIRSRKIDVVCVHTEKELRVAGAAALLAKVPVVFSREVDLPLKDTRVNRLSWGRIVSAVIANSHATKNTLLVSAPFLREKPIEVIWKGVDLARYRSARAAHLRDEFHLTKRDILIGFVGRLDEQKGVQTLLEAMRQVSAASPHARLILVGDGNLRSAVERFSETHRLTRSIILAGFRSDVPEFLRAIDFLVMPSNWEGFGYAAAEAMAAGKAVIATHVSSLPELVDDKRTGILVPPRSPRDLARAMLTMVQKPALRLKMGRGGAAKAKDLFTLREMVDKTEAVLESAVRNGRSG